jgi:hypothetical protein
LGVIGPVWAGNDAPFSNDGTLQDPPRATLKPDHLRAQVAQADCRRLVAHQPAAGVAYQPGVDVRGNAVAPADLPGSQSLGQKLLEEGEIAFDLALNPLLFAGNPALADRIEGARITLGRIAVDPATGDTTFDGQALSDPQQAAIAKACRARLDAP